MQKESNKQEAKLQSARSKLDKELTGDKDADTVVTTPQSQWTPFQIAVANLNPELKQRNKRYQSALNNLNILENEKVNLQQAGQLMMDMYKESINRTEDAAERQMAANSANAAIQAWGAISGMAWLATNPAAAAAARNSARNQAIIQNNQVRSWADQNIASVMANAAQIPNQLASMSAQQAQTEANQAQIEANNNLTNAQAEYYRRQWTSTTSSSSNSSSNNISNIEDTTSNDQADSSWYAWEYSYRWTDWKDHKITVWNQWFFLDWKQVKSSENIDKLVNIINRQLNK